MDQNRYVGWCEASRTVTSAALLCVCVFLKMRETEMLRLEEICEQAKVPLLVVRIYGLVGYLRVRTPASPPHRGSHNPSPPNSVCHAASVQTPTNTSPWTTVHLSQGVHLSPSLPLTAPPCCTIAMLT